MTQQIRSDRDRYVAFAFAAADLLLELNREQRVVTVLGAPQSVVGRSAEMLVGSDIAALVAPGDAGLIRRLVHNVERVGRIDPVILRCRHPAAEATVVLLGGCALPTMKDAVFLSMTVLPDGIAPPEQPRDDATGLLTKEALLTVANQAATDVAGRPNRELTLVRLEGLAGAARGMSPDRADLMMNEIGAALRAQSAGGDSVARLGDNEFGLIRLADADNGSEQAMLKDIDVVVTTAGVPRGAVVSSLSRISLQVGTLNRQEAARSIAYAVNTFSRGKNVAATSLQDGLTAAMEDTMQRFGELKTVLESDAFNLVFQPVVSLKNRMVHHHEALSRFTDGRTPFETITFSEEIGLVHHLDLAVCRKAIAALDRAEGSAIAVNLSGSSIQNEAFRQSLSELIRPLQHLRTRLLFELTESSEIENLEEAAGFLRWVRKLGFAICLDDFGAGAAAYSYLRRFDVDYVKVDGPFLRDAVNQPRERALIRSICRLCDELGSEVIGEMIEDENMVFLSKSIGITLGQGYLFGKPVPVLSPESTVVNRRRGATVSWQ